MADAYHEEEVEGEKRVVLRLHPAIAPLKAAVFPLVNKDGMPELARRIFDDLRKRYNAFYDDGGSIGRRYRRQDEAGTPFGITIDGQSTQDGSVTVRDRDTLQQVRIAADRLAEYLAERLGENRLAADAGPAYPLGTGRRPGAPVPRKFLVARRR